MVSLQRSLLENLEVQAKLLPDIGNDLGEALLYYRKPANRVAARCTLQGIWRTAEALGETTENPFERAMVAVVSRGAKVLENVLGDKTTS